jgi:hypothetical protein
VDLGRLLELDSLEPGARIEAMVAGDDYLRDVACTILLTLVEIDARLEGCLRVSSLYLVEGRALYEMFAKVLPPGLSDDDIRSALLLLNSSSLIFRFTCARKFRVADARLKQMRVNTWGKWYVVSRGLDQRYPGVRGQVGAATAALLAERRDAYARLSETLCAPISQTSAEVIGVLNRAVSLKLLS